MFREELIVFGVLAFLVLMFTLAMFRINFWLGIGISIFCLGFWFTVLGVFGVIK